MAAWCASSRASSPSPASTVLIPGMEKEFGRNGADLPIPRVKHMADASDLLIGNHASPRKKDSPSAPGDRKSDRRHSRGRSLRPAKGEGLAQEWPPPPQARGHRQIHMGRSPKGRLICHASFQALAIFALALAMVERPLSGRCERQTVWPQLDGKLKSQVATRLNPEHDDTRRKSHRSARLKCVRISNAGYA